MSDCAKESRGSPTVDVQGVCDAQQAGQLSAINPIQSAIGKGAQILREFLLELWYRPPMAMGYATDRGPIEAAKLGILDRKRLANHILVKGRDVC
jgi:hypothetical protein